MKVRTGLFAAAIVSILSVAAPALAAETCAGKSGPHSVSVLVSGIRNAKGEVAITLYPDDPKRFLAPRGKLMRQRVKAEAPVTKACFFVDPGVYAIAVYHDTNADRDFNRNPVGMPTEGFGFSNDPPTKFGIPSFESVRFRFKPGQPPVAIRMRYAR